MTDKRGTLPNVGNVATIRMGPPESAWTMKKGKTSSRKEGTTDSHRVHSDEILPEYDFSRGRRNPYAHRYSAANVVELDADVARTGFATTACLLPAE